MPWRASRAEGKLWRASRVDSSLWRASRAEWRLWYASRADSTPWRPQRAELDGPWRTSWAHAAPLLLGMLLLAACEHKVKVEAPKDPIVINLNIKIEQEIRVKVENDVDALIDGNNDLF
jgi:hypothetical protein